MKKIVEFKLDGVSVWIREDLVESFDPLDNSTVRIWMVGNSEGYFKVDGTMESVAERLGFTLDRIPNE